jgi:ABC-type sugar transport system ATPase subunit
VDARIASGVLRDSGGHASPHRYLSHSPTSQNPVRLSALTKTYPDGTEAVKGIDLDIAEGSFVVLLGPSGCGKTTTLRMIAGLESVSSGSIHFADLDVTDMPASQRDVGFVFQFYALYPHMTVRENIGFPLGNQGITGTDQRARIHDISNALGIAQLLDQHPGQLSGGDQQRVSLARAMVRNPAINLMDEPLGQLDTNIRLELREVIRAQQIESGITTVYVTHDQEEALSLADTVVVMNEGRIEQIGSPEDVYGSPACLFVADFVGSPGMNLISGTAAGDRGSLVFQSGSVSMPIPDMSPRGAVQMGIRPEFVTLGVDSGIPGVVAVSEYFGDHYIVHLSTDMGPVVARSSRNLSVGKQTRLQFSQAHIRVFETETGKRVL